MQIGKLQKILDHDSVKLVSNVETSRGKFDLWFAVDRKYEDYTVDENLDAFLLALLPHAMVLGEDIYLEGQVSEKLYYNLSRYYIQVKRVGNPVWHQISIHPSELNSSRLVPNGDGVATGFSGGIDSFCLLGDYYFKPVVPEHYKVTHLIYNNVGSLGEDYKILSPKDYQRVSRFAEEAGLPLIKIDSNLNDILTGDFLPTSFSRNAAAVMILQKLFSKYLYASSHRHEDFLKFNEHEVGYMEHLIFPFLSTESFETILAGTEYIRTEKTKKVAELELSYKYLFVCINSKIKEIKNCSQCIKCVRTMITLDILGLLQLYKDLFDLEKFHKMKRPYFDSVFYDNGIFGNEILALASEYDYRVPGVSKILGSKYVYPLLQNFRRKAPYSLRQRIKAISGLSRV
jgi:hypothetical protein